MSLLLAVTGWNLEPWLDRFRRFLPGREVVSFDRPFDPATIRYAATWKHPAGALSELPNLDVIFSLGAGVDHLLNDPYLPARPIVRVVDPDLTGRMSEWVVMHCLMHLRRARFYLDRQAETRWEDLRDQPAAHEIRVGIMGLGVLGGDSARKLKAIGFDVGGWSRSPRQIDGIPTWSGSDGLRAFLGRTDILVSLLPLTPDTRGILGRELFAGLARDGRLGGPIFLNAGRGGLQREADILACLEDGTLKAATLDVFETEPLPTTSPLWRHPAVTITPHNAAASDPDAVARAIARQITDFEAGEPLRDVVDPATGY